MESIDENLFFLVLKRTVVLGANVSLRCENLQPIVSAQFEYFMTEAFSLFSEEFKFILFSRRRFENS